MKYNYLKKAFTLAEVLITLGIIGVVAALTLPALIQNHKKQVYVNQLKKVVNILENAARMAVAQEGVSSFKESEFYCKFLDFYVCGEEKELSKRDEIAKKYFKYVSFVNNLTNSYVKKDLITNQDVYLYGSEMVLADGAVIVTTSFNSNSGYFVDVNGDKGPNVIGRDVFLIHLNADGIVEEHDISYYGYTCKNVSESQYLEKGCYYSKIVADGWKMNY